MRSVPAPASPVHLHITDSAGSIPSIGFSPKQLDPIDQAFELGYSFAGCVGQYDPPPAFDEAESAAFNAGFALGRERSAAFPDAPRDSTHYDSADSWDDWVDGIAVSVPISPADNAWWAGFQLGLDGIPVAASEDMEATERAAFVAGHDIGHACFVEDCERDHAEAMDRLDWAFRDPYDLMSEAELCEAVGSVAARSHAARG